MKRLFVIFAFVFFVLSILSCQAVPKKTLYVFNWTDYIEPKLIRQFEKKYNCKVVYDTYNSNENMLTKLQTSNVIYDIIVPSGDHISILLEMDLLEPLDKTLLTNYYHLDPTILKRALEYDPGNEYSVPYFWGTTGIIYNTHYLSNEEMENISWDIFSDERFADKKVISFLDDVREVIGIALVYNGFDPNDYSDEALAIVRETLNRWNKNVAQYDSDSFKNEVQDGTIWLGQAYNGDALQVMDENEDIGFALPIEGSTLWIDFIAIQKNSENKELAHQFIDFLLEPKTGLINAEYVMYATPNKSVYNMLDQAMQDNTLIYPPDEYLEKCLLIKKIDEHILKFDEIWRELRNY